MYKVPVLMYHSVGQVSKKWKWNHLTCPTEVFRKNLQWLKDNKYTTISLYELYSYIYKKERLPKNSIVITFDDGYLDNYHNAFPLLSEYGFCGTVFVNPEFIDENKTQNIPDNRSRGFCNWQELKEMQNSGVFEVESHTMTHTWYNISERLIDFRHPNDNYIWATWNENINEKPYTMIDNMNLMVLGQPIYEHEKSLLANRVSINQDIVILMNSFVIKEGGEDFFMLPNWKKLLTQKYNEIIKSFQAISITESEHERCKRMEYEILGSKEIIEEKLQKKVNFLCWPGGSGSKKGVDLAKKYGYLMTTAAKDLSYAERKGIPNSPQLETDRIHRIGTTLGNNKIHYSEYRSFGLKVNSFGKGKLFRGVFNLLGILCIAK